MSGRGRAALLCALAVVFIPVPAWADYHAPPPNILNPSPTSGGQAPSAIAFADQPIKFSGTDVYDVPLEVHEIDGTIPDHNDVPDVPYLSDELCDGYVIDPDEDPWVCSRNTTFFPKGLHTFRVTTKADPPGPQQHDNWEDVTVRIGASALKITSKRLTRHTMTIEGTRDAGAQFGVLAAFDPSGGETTEFHTLALTQTICDSSPASGNHFKCTYDFDGDLTVGQTISVTVSEIASDVPVSQRSTNLTVADDPADPPGTTPDDPPGGPPGSNSPPTGPGPGGSGPGSTQPIPLSTPAPSSTPEPGTAAAPAPTQTAESPKTPKTSPPGPPAPDIDVLRLLLLMVIAFAILAMIGPHGLAFASDPGRRLRERSPLGSAGGHADGRGSFGRRPDTDTDSPDAAAGAGASLTLAALAAEANREKPDDGSSDGRRYGIAWGDKSPSWQFPGWKWIDRLSLHGPVSTAPRLPLVARIGADATYLRAALGSLWVLFPAAGLVLGIFAANSTGGLPIAPSTGITTALLVLALLDATSGAVAVLGFTAIVLARGGLTGDGLSLADGLRGLLGLAALWFAIPLIAAAARPFRRLAQPRRVYGWDRVGDAAIASLVGGWAVLGVVSGFSDLLGRPVAVAHHAGALAFLTIGVIVARMVVEEVVAAGYPARLRAVQHVEPFPEPTPIHQLRGILVRGALMGLFASAVIGNCWQLWTGMALYVVPQVATLVEDELPNIGALHRRLPRGIVEILLMLVVGAVLARLIDSAYSDEPSRALRDGFLLLALPGFVLTTLGILGRTSPAPPWTWPRQLAGAVIVVVTVVLALVLL